MYLTRFNPYWEFNTIAQEMEKMMKTMPPAHHHKKGHGREFVPGVDILEDKKNIYFEVEIAGVPKDDVKVSVNDDNILTIKGEKKFTRQDEVRTCCRNERRYGSFIRSFQLPEQADAGRIEAGYENGILKLTVPKMKSAEKAKEIEIN